MGTTSRESEVIEALRAEIVAMRKTMQEMRERLKAQEK